MSFADVFAGYQGAAADHYSKLLEMQYGQRQAIAAHFAKMADDPRFDPDTQMTIFQHSLDVGGGDPMKPVSSKDMDVSKLMVQRPAPAPVNIPASGGQPTPQSTLQQIQGGAVPSATGQMPPQQPSFPQNTPEIAPRTIQAPAPPPQPIGMMSIAQQQGVQQQGLAGQLKVQRDAENADILQRVSTIKQIDPTVDPQMAAMLALKMPLGPLMGTERIPDVGGDKIPFDTDGFGDPVDHSPGTKYTLVQNKLGQPVSVIPNNTRFNSGLRYGQTEDGQSHWFVSDDRGNVKVMDDSPIAHMLPLGALPRTSTGTSNVPRLVLQPDNTLQLQMVPESQTRTTTVGGQRPAGQIAPQTAPAPTPPQRGPALQPQPAAPPSASAPQAAAPSAMPSALAPMVSAQQQASAPAPIPPQTGGAPAPATAKPAQPKAKAATAAAPVAPATKPSGVLKPGDTAGGHGLNPEQVEKDQKQGSAFNNTVERMVNVYDHADMLKSLIEGTATGKLIQYSIDPKESKLVLSKAIGLTPEETVLASDYASLSEDILSMRNIYGVSPSRGQEAFHALQMQKGNLIGDTGVFKGTLKNSLQSFIGQLATINQNLQPAGRELQTTPAIKRAYHIVANGDARDPAGATARAQKTWDALMKDKWKP